MSGRRDRRGEHLVLGAGPTGLAVARALKEAQIPYQQVEATDHVGGNWAHGVYETAHIISSRKTTEYPDYPMPQDYPDFPSADQMCAYFESFFQHFGLEENVRFETRVQSVQQLDDERWLVSYEDEGAVDEVYDGVLVCNGHHWAKHWPGWVEGFEGEVLHSKDYRRPDELRGKRVLVVGGGNSGVDLVCEAARVGAVADWSLRRGMWVIPKTFAGKPTVELMQGWAPMAVQRALAKALIRVAVGRYEDYGLPVPDHEPFETHPTVSSEIFHYLAHGRVTPRSGVERVEGRRVYFRDGAQGEYDLVACGTGYDVTFPFLEEGLIEYRDRKTPRLVGGNLVPGRKGLYVVGAYQVRYGIGPLLRPLAVMLARWIRLQREMELPLADVMLAAGVEPVDDHLVDPHQAMRRMKMARLFEPLLRRRERSMRRRREASGSSARGESAAAPR